MQDYPREFDTANAAALYAAIVDGWKGMLVEIQKDGSYKLTLEWADDDTEEAQKENTVH